MQDINRCDLREQGDGNVTIVKHWRVADALKMHSEVLLPQVQDGGSGFQSLSLFQNSSHHPEPESSSALDDDFLRRRFLRGSTGAAAGDSIAMRTMLSK